MRTQHDKDIEFVLWYAYKNRYGFFDDLDKLNKPDIVAELCVVGFIKTGFARNGKTYAITPLGMRYYNVIKSPRKTLFYRLFHKCLER